MGIRQSQLIRSPRITALGFRVLAHLGLAVVALTVPEVGPNRFWLAAVLIGFSPPVAILLNQYVDDVSRNWAEAFFDLLLVVTFVHLVPHLWVAAMCLGLMVALAPSVSLHPASHWVYMGFGAILITGMTFAAVVHDIVGWELAIAAVVLTYPAMLYYTYTQMRRAEDLRQRAQQMRGMAELAGSVAHDFNNMLMSVSAHTELALMELPEEHPAREHLEEVLTGAERASLLCGQLLSFAGRNIDQQERLNLLDELQLMTGLLRSLLPTGVAFDIEAPPWPLYIDSSASKLHQVLMNILMNAGEAMTEHDPVIEIHLTSVPGDGGDGTEDRQVQMIIADRGHGIPKTDQTRVFDPLYTTKEHGHGLGLASVKRIMEEHDGTIAIRERTSGGTEVRLRWPESKSVEQLGARRAPQSQRSDGTVAATPGDTVMVVDDESNIRKAAQALLESLGFGVVTATNADQATAVFERDHQRIAAVLLDLKMPGKDGWACLHDLRRISPKTLVVICTGYNSQDHLPPIAREDPNLRFLSKPFRAEKLADALKPV